MLPNKPRGAPRVNDRRVTLRQTFTVVIRQLERMVAACGLTDVLVLFMLAATARALPNRCHCGSLCGPQEDLAVLREELHNLQGGLAERTQSGTRSSPRARRVLSG